MFDDDTAIVGARLGVTSDNRETHGIDIGLLAAITHIGSGINIAPFVKSDHHTGLQLGLASHTLRTDGILIAPYSNWFVMWEGRPDATMVNGAQIGFVSMTNEVNGVQLSALMNLANDVDGLQIGVANKTKRVGFGSQLGLVNVAERGLQIGLLNFNKNGFLPFFPLINF